MLNLGYYRDVDQKWLFTEIENQPNFFFFGLHIVSTHTDMVTYRLTK